MKYDVLDLVEEGSLLRNLSGFGNFVQKTNTGTLTLNFASDSSTEEDGFEIDWQCAERTLSSSAGPKVVQLHAELDNKQEVDSAVDLQELANAKAQKLT